jgi:hypothetical protein
VAWYNVDFDCPRCGKIHGVLGWPGGGLRIENGPERAGTVAELYADRELATVLVGKLNDKVWCGQAGDYILMDDPARLILTRKKAGT